ncbi:MAG: hypothetical protein INH34_15570 [Phycisphaerales bacterium]|nr:hypothetical protein [Phycisphaerales bacterium]
MGRRRTVRRREQLPPPTEAQLAAYASYEQHLGWHVARFGVWRARVAGLDREDLMQAARLGLWRACLTFDPALGCVLATHATKHVYWHLHDAIERAKFGKPRKGRPLHDHAAHEYLAFDPPAPETPDDDDDPDC